MGILDDMGVIKLKVNYSFNKSIGLFKEKIGLTPIFLLLEPPKKQQKNTSC